MSDRAIVTGYELDSNQSGLILLTHVSFVRDGGGGINAQVLPVIILAGDTVNQIGVKVIAEIRSWALANTYDVNAAGQILLPSYSKST